MLVLVLVLVEVWGWGGKGRLRLRLRLGGGSMAGGQGGEPREEVCEHGYGEMGIFIMNKAMAYEWCDYIIY